MISIKKIDIAKEEVRSKCPACKGRLRIDCFNCLQWGNFIDRMANSEIPVDYWFRDMKEFYGFVGLKDLALDMINNIENVYKTGRTVYIAGERGRGKTMAVCSILKTAILKDFSSLYINLSDMVTRVTNTNPSLKLEIKDIDFLVIDEIDNRFFPTQSSMKLYGGQLESVLRSRMQNKLPTIMCSNSHDVGEVFEGQFRKSFQSLFSQFVETIRVGGPDARKNREKLNG